MALPTAFARRMVEVHGDAGRAWLERLPALLAEGAARWALTLLPPFRPLSYNYVAPAVRADGTPVVLKVGVPNAELLTETAALHHFAGRGAVRLLDADPAEGMLLLERLRPGTRLSAMADDEAATATALRVMRQLWRPVPEPHRFPTAATWAAGLGRLRARFADGNGPFPAALLDKAERLFAELLASSAAPVLLHGDLHHENILAAERAPWLAIDPKGIVGEPAYETGALLRNRLPRPLAGNAAKRVLARRAAQLAEGLGVARARVLGWSIAQAVLSAGWTYEDHGRVDAPMLQCARLLADIAAETP